MAFRAPRSGLRSPSPSARGPPPPRPGRARSPSRSRRTARRAARPKAAIRSSQVDLHAEDRQRDEQRLLADVVPRWIVEGGLQLVAQDLLGQRGILHLEVQPHVPAGVPVLALGAKIDPP